MVVGRLLSTAGFVELNAISWEFNEKESNLSSRGGSNELDCCVRGVRPGLKSKLLNRAGFEYIASCDRALDEIELFEDKPVKRSTLERWACCYQQLENVARIMGIPEAAIPKIKELSVSNVQACRDHLRGMIASFQSSGL